MRKIKYIPQLVAAIIISELAGVIGSLFTTTAVNGWYTLLVRPSFAPPSWIFGPVWTTLFLLMGIASFLVWRKGKTEGFSKRIRIALTLFGIQLVLNTFWSIIFFGSEISAAHSLKLSSFGLQSSQRLSHSTKSLNRLPTCYCRTLHG